jgi:hypothetical protein
MMKMKRFDTVEYKVMQCGKGGTYYPDDTDEAERALLLMDEGVFEKNPRNRWSESGWKFTKRGEQYYQAFMKAVREKHGHIWKTHRDNDPDSYQEGDVYGDIIDIFALSHGYHNGPECKKCGYSFCQHCDCEFDVPHCTG